MQKKKAISLIVLVITIIILAILATTTVITLNNSGLIPFTQNAAFKGRVSTYLEELSYHHAKMLAADKEYNPADLNKSAGNEVATIITSMKEEDKPYFYIEEGKLRVHGTIGTDKVNIARELGVLSDSEQDSMYDEVVEITPQSRFTYTISNGEAIIYGFSYELTTDEKESITNIVIPYEIEKAGIKYPVTSIGTEAFYNCSSLTSVTIPGSVTSIGERAFDNTAYYNNINNWENGILYMGNNLIGADRAISGEVVIKSGVKCIAARAFYNCSSLTSITIPGSVTSIGKFAFSDCSGLTSITILEGVTSIGGYAFYNCSSLASATIPGSVTSIGERAFDNTAYYNDINNWENGILYMGNNLIGADRAISGEVVIKSGVKCIADRAFYNCSSLTSVTIPGSVTSIGIGVFYYCSNLTSVTIPGSVTSIGGGAFYNCSSLTSITIPGSVTSIGDSAFEDCSRLTSITIPDSVTTIGSHAFYCCGNLRNINYQGTKEQWNAITFGANWDYRIDGCVIHCTNGDISK